MTVNSASLQTTLHTITRIFKRYIVVLFLLFLTGIYGFLAWRIVVLQQAEPDLTTTTSQIKSTGVPRVDEDVLTKIQELQDNSVEVQTLFNEARSNPFSE